MPTFYRESIDGNIYLVYQDVQCYKYKLPLKTGIIVTLILHPNHDIFVLCGCISTTAQNSTCNYTVSYEWALFAWNWYSSNVQLNPIVRPCVLLRHPLAIGVVLNLFEIPPIILYQSFIISPQHVAHVVQCWLNENVQDIGGKLRSKGQFGPNYDV